jgi:hypothetical protein
MPELTPEEQLQLLGLLTLAQRHAQQLEQIEEAIASVLDLTDGDPNGFITDAVHTTDGNPIKRLNTLLEQLGLKVLEQKP